MASVPKRNEACPKASMFQEPTLAPPRLQVAPVSLHVPAVPGSNTMPFKAIPGLSGGADRGVTILVGVGATVTETEMFCAAMVLGLSWDGNVPTAWSGKPLALSERKVLLQDQVAVAVAFTDGLLLKTLLV